MNRKRIVTYALSVLMIGIFPTLGNADKPMHPTLEKIDLDGDMVLFLNTETLEMRIIEYIEKMGDMIMKSMVTSSPDSLRAVGEGIETAKTAIQWSGLFSLEAYAMSMAPAEEGLSRVVSIGQHAEVDSHKPIWRLMGSEPDELEGIEFVPANAVYTANSSTSLDETWKIVNDAVSTFGSPENTAAFNQYVMMAQMLIGTNISAITESIDNDILISLQLSDVKTVTFPQRTGANLTIPEPSLLFGLGINDPMLGNIVLQKLQLVGMPPVKSMHDENELYTLNLPIPSPVPLSPTLVMTDDYLLIGSSLGVVKEALDCEKNESGLVSTPLYKQLLKNAPEETSAIEFVSPRFMKTYFDVLGKAMNDTNEPEFESMMKMMTESWGNMYAGGYALKTPAGFYSESHVNYGGAKPVELAASSYIGVLAAIAIPSFQKAQHNAQERSCENNRRMIETAKELWALENDKAAGTPVTETDLIEYLPGGTALVCPAGGTYTITPVGTDCECSVHNAAKKIKHPVVDERVPVAWISGRQVTSHHPLVVDRHGFVFPLGTDEVSLPLIQGLDLDLSPGQIESSDVETALQIIELCDKSSYMREYIHIESLDLKNTDYIDMRLAGDTRVRMPRSSLKTKLQNLATVIKIANGQDRKIKEVDLTLDSSKVPVTYY